METALSQLTSGDQEFTVIAANDADLPEALTMMRDVLDKNLGGYRQEWHRDLDNLGSTYLNQNDHQLLIARGREGVLGTAALRPCALASPPNPGWLAAEYNRPDTCQLVRVWVAEVARRRGVGGALVRAAVAWACGLGGYRRVYLHTDAAVPGAESFWRSLPGHVVYDTRPDPYNTVHFELDVERILGAPSC
ncbi:MAG: GNAT family N-acetyltransferase [Actinomycetota bacterium]